MVASHVPPAADLALNPGMCPDWESNQRPFGSQVGTGPHQPGLIFYLLYCIFTVSFLCLDIQNLTIVLQSPVVFGAVTRCTGW